jgi:hypothetical protein
MADTAAIPVLAECGATPLDGTPHGGPVSAYVRLCPAGHFRSGHACTACAGNGAILCAECGDKRPAILIPAETWELLTSGEGDRIVRWREVRPGDLVLLGDELITAENAEVVPKPWGDGTLFDAVDIGHRLDNGFLVFSEQHGDRYTAVRHPSRPLEAIGAGPLLDPDCRDGKCGSCVGAPCEHSCHQGGPR